jgi:hypothetical protein
VKDLGKKEKLVPYLDKAWETFDDPWTFDYTPKVGDHGWHPSGHCTPTVVELYDYALAFLKAHPPSLATIEGEIVTRPPVERMGARNRKAFMNGHYWHQAIQYVVVNKLGWCGPDDIERHGIKYWKSNEKDIVRWKDFRAAPFHYVTGSGDIVPCVAPNWTGLVDIKTMKHDHFRAAGLPTDTYGGDYSTADKYECQVNIYMDLFKQDSAIILAVDKDTGDFKEFMFERNQELIDVIYDKWKFVSHLLDTPGAEPLLSDNDLFPLPLTGPVAQ